MGPEKDQIETWRVRGKAYELAERDPEERKRISEFGGARWIFAADLNNDGWLDLIVPQITGPRAFIFLGGPDGFSDENSQTLAVDAAAVANAADLDGDGYIDLVFACHMSLGHTYPQERGKFVIYWGGEDGINETRYTALPSIDPHGICTVDIGNVMDRSNSEYYTSEAYKSETKATRISWEATNGKKTWVKVQLRCADTPEALESAEWSESFENGADISALNLKGYIQYKLELGAYCGVGTPRLTEVTVDFE